jgi:hypothetical protein
MAAVQDDPAEPVVSGRCTVEELGELGHDEVCSHPPRCTKNWQRQPVRPRRGRDLPCRQVASHESIFVPDHDHYEDIEKVSRMRPMPCVNEKPRRCAHSGRVGLGSVNRESSTATRIRFNPQSSVYARSRQPQARAPAIVCSSARRVSSRVLNSVDRRHRAGLSPCHQLVASNEATPGGLVTLRFRYPGA